MKPEVGVMQIPLHFQTANIFSGPDILVVLGIAVLLFGGKKLPELAKGLGEGIKSFKQAVKEEEHPPAAAATPATAEPKKTEQAS
jgi:sec-independent protein translocase protein TatA